MSGISSARVTTVRAMIAPPQLRPTLSWKKMRTASAMSISGCGGLYGDRRDHDVRLTVVVGGVDRADPQREALRDRVEAAVAERVAAQQAPGGEEQRRAATPKRSIASAA